MYNQDSNRSAPLTPIQLGMFFQSLARPGSGVDVEQLVGELREPIDAARFRLAFEQVAAEEPRFATWIDGRGGEETRQVRAASGALPNPLEFYETDASDLSEIDREARFAEFLERDRARGFDLTAAPLSRVALFTFGREQVRLVWTVHHILLDGWSFPLLLRAVFARYRALGSGETPRARPIRDFMDEVPRLLSRDAAADEAFWRPRVAGLADLVGILRPAEDRDFRDTVDARGSSELTQRMRTRASALEVRPSTLISAAWAVALARHSGSRDVVFGVTACGRTRGADGNGDVLGVFIDTLPLRVTLDAGQPVEAFLRELRAEQKRVRAHARTPLAEIQRYAGLSSGRALFESLLVYDDESLDRMLAAGGEPEWAQRSFRLIERTGYPVTLYVRVDDAVRFELVFDPERLPRSVAERLLAHARAALEALANPEVTRVGALEVLGADEREALRALGQGPSLPIPPVCIHDLVLETAARVPNRTALICRDRAVDYATLLTEVDRWAAALVAAGVSANQAVGLSAGRSIEMVIGMLAILRAGGAYVPLDPSYPADRLAFMLEDSGARVLLADREWPGHSGPLLRLDRPLPESAPVALAGRVTPEDLAYVIYTSGSTGKPKGVMIEHRNVLNFFEGMDRDLAPRLEREAGPGTWLAVTSPSFDISVLELLYTLARGFTVVVAADEDRLGSSATRRGLSLSLFYFASDQGAQGPAKYRLLLDGARFADANGFEAVWVPERHFHAFGGLYPNPAVAAAAIAATTQKVGIRAGSVVVPLHDPIRIAEEWAVVDNMSGGRVGISVASGWHPDDFVFAPDNHARRKEAMIEGLDTVRRLWRGEAIERPGPGGRTVSIRTLPRPMQPELPFWLTAAGNPETFRQAGALGANVLTHLLGQTVESVGANLAVYRKAYREAGHTGSGRVTLMLHALVGESDEAVKATVREPMKAYLRSSVDLVKGFASEWTAYSKRAGATTPKQDAIETLSPDEMESLLDYAFERFYTNSALFGTVEQCSSFLERLEQIGVDEIACLVDFGVPVEETIRHFEFLARLRAAVAPRQKAEDAPADYSLGTQIERHGVTHLQCTPSMARMLLLDGSTAQALGSLEACMIGGEAFPPDLAAALVARVGGRVINMYGPTETTIWSSTHPVTQDVAAGGMVPIGRPIANTSLVVVHPEVPEWQMPRGAIGELCIGGAGVVRGYHQRPELTADRFVEDRFGGSGKLYRTGDRARFRDDGAVEFLGRIDHQVKIRGHRIELGEIEAALGRLGGVREGVVLAREDRPGDQRLVAYVVKAEGAAIDAAAVKQFLSRSLPSFMVPQQVVFLDAFPHTPNQKIDRKALPAPEAQSVEESYVAPAVGLESAISGIWREVLAVERVGTRDNFFDLGGHSILAVQVHGRLQKLLGRTLPITDLFRFPTIARLAAHLGGEAPAGGSTIGRAEDRGRARRARFSRQKEGTES